ncbi:uncharacterized protein TM35_000311610 [Trypanosoma theileri]|uniref:Uncharacterized protein n=1 Tax=Trypanosoma theileri TaxID=67003 RepID=A0A1X0NML8_9TRYP|nr:uncharacterized protein TM35_000311610 [Trypanosoma theileri]ORC85975.1 hypothetical protein TM35_000311610 [Trypanosoma theileri]
MSMLPYRVLCLLAIVLCCVGVTHADDVKRTSIILEEARDRGEKTSKLKEECDRAGKEAEEAAHNATVFAQRIESSVDKIAVDPKEVEKKKLEGDALIKKARRAAAKAREVAQRTEKSATETHHNAMYALGQAKHHHGSLKGKNVKAPFADMKTAAKNVGKEAQDARQVVRKTKGHARKADAAIKNVKDALKKLDTAVAAAAAPKNINKQQIIQTMENNVKPQTHSQMQEPLPTNEGSVTMGAHETSGLLNTVEVNGTHLEERHHIDAEESNTSEHYHAQQKKEEVRNSTDQRSHERSEAKEMTDDLHTPQAQTQQGNLSENQTHSGRILRQTQYFSYPYSSDTPNLREMAANALLKSDALAKAVHQLDGSSSPALLRVPLLLLLLSVLGCMTVC